MIFPEIPLYDAVVAEHGDVLNSGTPDEGGRIPAFPTPLMDDVKAHGVGPWDEDRRSYLARHLPAPTPAPRPRQPRKARVTKSKP